MNIEELHDYLKGFRRSQTTAKGVGCDKEVVIRTATASFVNENLNGNNEVCNAEDLISTHYKQILAEIENNVGCVVYLRTLSEVKQVIEDDGEFIGNYCMRTRLQFGTEGKCITVEQYYHLVGLGWSINHAN